MPSDVRFERPPVRKVTLTVYFELSTPLQVMHLSPLRQLWRSEFPETQELAPLAPLGGRHSEVEYVSPDSPWLFPQLVFSDSGSERQITIQSDRFSLTWAFQAKAADQPSPGFYPGYEELRKDLESRLGLFTKIAMAEADARFEYSAIECRYENQIEGYSGSELAVGVLTGWAERSSAVALIPLNYAGMRLHQCASEENQESAVLVGVDSEIDNLATMFIEVTKKVDEAQAPLEALDIAHDVLISTFLQTSSASQRENWGEIA
jgi:hypothetical protein